MHDKQPFKNFNFFFFPFQLLAPTDIFVLPILTFYCVPFLRAIFYVSHSQFHEVGTLAPSRLPISPGQFPKWEYMSNPPVGMCQEERHNNNNNNVAAVFASQLVPVCEKRARWAEDRSENRVLRLAPSAAAIHDNTKVIRFPYLTRRRFLPQSRECGGIGDDIVTCAYSSRPAMFFKSTLREGLALSRQCQRKQTCSSRTESGSSYKRVEAI